MSGARFGTGNGFGGNGYGGNGFGGQTGTKRSHFETGVSGVLSQSTAKLREGLLALKALEPELFDLLLAKSETKVMEERVRAAEEELALVRAGKIPSEIAVKWSDSSVEMERKKSIIDEMIAARKAFESVKK
ncbi:hypothetical protein PFISCL1PPCAC_18709, partial [Pristionchus fissidentatus]